MFKNYFKIAWRLLWKDKLFSFVNIMGLGLAIPFALLSLMQVQSRFEADNFHADSERVYRVITHISSDGGTFTSYASSPLALAGELKEKFPFVEEVTNTRREGGWELTNNIKTIRVNPLFVEPAFFEMFAFPLEKGSIPAQSNTLVISQEMAGIFFGEADPVGETLSHHEYGDLIITGVLKPHKRNTHFRSDVMVSMATNSNLTKEASGWSNSGYTYVKMHEEGKKEILDAALVSLAKTAVRLQPDVADKKSFRSQPFSKISPDLEGLEDNPYTETLADLSVNLIIALAIILLAGFNYTNLTLARSLGRAKEVDIRKVTGASRLQLITQFICEAILVALLSLLIGYGVLKFIEHFVHVQWINWQVDNDLILWGIFILFTIVTGTLAGIVPAHIISGFPAAKVLKGNIIPASFGKLGFRKSLVVIQFVVTACFVFLMANMYSQFRYQATESDNFNRKNIFNISVKGNHQLLRNDIAAHPDVESIGFTSSPFGGTFVSSGIEREKISENTQAAYYAVDADSASNFVLVNEQTLYVLGLGEPQEAIGKTFFLNDAREVVIRGVVKNFNYSLYQFATKPLVLQYDPSKFQVLNIKTRGMLEGDAFQADMAVIWKKYHLYEGIAFSDYEQELYERYWVGDEMKFMAMMALTIFLIAIMGLLGIVTYTNEKRFKEIGIRKVMGASVSVLIKELSAGFLKMLIIAAAICLPLGYLISWVFVNMFAFNNGVATGLMLLLLILILFIALVTIAIQTEKAATANPVKNLRTE